MKAAMPVKQSVRESSRSAMFQVAHEEKVYVRRTERMKRFLNDSKKYYKYAVYSAKSKLQSEVVNAKYSKAVEEFDFFHRLVGVLLIYCP